MGVARWIPCGPCARSTPSVGARLCETLPSSGVLRFRKSNPADPRTPDCCLLGGGDSLEGGKSPGGERSLDVLGGKGVFGKSERFFGFG